METRNAIIRSVRLDRERGCLSASLELDYGGTRQMFGGYCLYAPKDWTDHGKPANYAGLFIFRCLQICDVEEWDQLVGQTVRVQSTRSNVLCIGHIVRDDWFNPSDEFNKLQGGRTNEA